MSMDLAMVLVLLAAAVAMFVRSRLRMDVVALIMICGLPLTGTITVGEALAGFSDPNIVLIALLFVLGEALVRTGIARRLGDWLNHQAGGSEVKLLALLMLAVAGLGSFISSTAIVAIFIPVVLRICVNTGMAPSRLLMPVSFAALISGMMTLVATAPNLVVNAEMMRQGEEGFKFFSITPFGIVILVLGIIYMVLVRHWLPDHRSEEIGEATRRPTFRDFIERYHLANRELRVRLQPGSPLVGRRLDELELRRAGATVLAIERRNGLRNRLVRPLAATELRADDVLLLDVRPPFTGPEVAMKWGVEILPLGETHRYLTDHSQELGMVEAIIPVESSLVGRTLLEARVRDESGLTVIGLRRGREALSSQLLEKKLQVGDTLLLTGFWEDIRRLQQDVRELVPLSLPAELDEVLPAHDKAPHALAIMALVIGLMVSGLLPNVQAVLIGILLMGLTGCVDLSSAYRSINWQVLVLIVGMMPFSLALQRTGAIDMIAVEMIGLLGDGSPRLILAAVFVVTAVLGMFISNTATAILMAPVALALAAQIGASPYPFAMVVALAASTAFMTPVSSPVNTLVVGPGSYSFGDFIRIGVPFSILALLVSVLLVPLLLPV